MSFETATAIRTAADVGSIYMHGEELQALQQAAPRLGRLALPSEYEPFYDIAQRLTAAKEGEMVALVRRRGGMDITTTIDMGVLQEPSLYYENGYFIPTSHHASVTVNHKWGEGGSTRTIPHRSLGVIMLGFGYNGEQHPGRPLSNGDASLLVGTDEIYWWRGVRGFENILERIVKPLIDSIT